jgi:SAM-dependent methyltransferase
MFDTLKQINKKPEVFEFYTASALWDDEHTSKQMLSFHLNESVDMSSRNIEFINASVEWISSKFAIDDHKRICDFGCGPGLYTTQFAEIGATVTGIDFSKRSIQYAKKTADQKKIGVDYQLRNYLDYRSDKRFDLITMIMCDFCALSPDQRINLLKVFHRHLDNTGSVLFDVYSENAFSQRKEAFVCEHQLLNGFWSANDYYGFLNTFKYKNDNVVLDKYTIIEESRSFEVFNWLQYFGLDSLKSELKKAGFVITEYYSDIAGKKYDSESLEFAIIAKKIV